MKKRPVCVVRGAHAGGAGAAAEGGDPAAGAEASAWVQSVAVCRGSDLVVRPSPARSRARKHWAPGRQRACVHAEAAAVCTHVATMLTAPVWPLRYLTQGAQGTARKRRSVATCVRGRARAARASSACCTGRPPGFVNGLALARSGRFALAGLGAEPRLGRWEVARGVRSGLLLHRLSLADEA